MLNIINGSAQTLLYFISRGCPSLSSFSSEKGFPLITFPHKKKNNASGKEDYNIFRGGQRETKEKYERKNPIIELIRQYLKPFVFAVRVVFFVPSENRFDFASNLKDSASRLFEREKMKIRAH